MAEHLSNLQLDELVTGAAQHDEHLAGCEECRQRLERLVRERAEIAGSAGFEQTFQRLARDRAERRSSFRPWILFAPLAAAAAAAVLLMVVPRMPEGDRIKGAPRLAVVGVDGKKAASFRVGERVFLSAAGAGLDHLVVFSRGDGGAFERVWPLDSNKASELSPDGAALLQPPFEVTPGDVALLGVFSKKPLDVVEARRILDAVPERGSDVVRMGSDVVVVRQTVRVDGDSR